MTAVMGRNLIHCQTAAEAIERAGNIIREKRGATGDFPGPTFFFTEWWGEGLTPKRAHDWKVRGFPPRLLLRMTDRLRRDFGIVVSPRAFGVDEVEDLSA
jgi:hypothetical protein